MSIRPQPPNVVKSFTPSLQKPFYYPTAKAIHRAKHGICNEPCACKSGDESKCGTSCTLRAMKIECGKNCVFGADCTNKEIQKRADSQRFEKRRVDYLIGDGIFAKVPLRIGAYVGQYAGEVETVEEYKDDLEGKYAQLDHHYGLSIGNGLVIDATERGNFTRFINHCCRPNLDVEYWLVDNLTRVKFVTNRNINRGEELSYDYKFARFDGMLNERPCYCGVNGCRGFF